MIAILSLVAGLSHASVIVNVCSDQGSNAYMFDNLNEAGQFVIDTQASGNKVRIVIPGEGLGQIE